MHSAVYPVLGNETGLPFYLSGIGRTEPEFHVKRENGLTSHQLLLTANGSGVLEVGEKGISLKKILCCIFRPHCRTNIIPSAEIGLPAGWCSGEISWRIL